MQTEGNKTRISIIIFNVDCTSTSWDKTIQNKVSCLAWAHFHNS